MPLTLSAAQIEDLLGALEAELRRRGLEGRVFLVGGAAMALAYNAGRSTGDVDGVLRPRDELLDAAHAVARERGLPSNWLSDGVTQAHMPPLSDDHPMTRRIGPALSIEIASPEYILAMKAMSTRLSDGDLRDAATLCRLLGYTHEEQIEAVIRRYFGADTGLFGAQELWFERIIDAASVPPE
ncbi:hypothetical protein [Tsukamurella sp. NPDC003166]|uniref:hypothetical protein n=1 Tax=Tsukamurella sp. NPDC003166 TaxID=3154444 RepID=UPI0033BB8F3C